MESLDNKNDIAFIDSHCHLQDYANEDLNDILNSETNKSLHLYNLDYDYTNLIVNISRTIKV